MKNIRIDVYVGDSADKSYTDKFRVERDFDEHTEDLIGRVVEELFKVLENLEEDDDEDQ